MRKKNLNQQYNRSKTQNKIDIESRTATLLTKFGEIGAHWRTAIVGC